jgi:hypothetical protein
MLLVSFFFCLWIGLVISFLFRCVYRLYMTVVVMVFVLLALYRSVGTPVLGVFVSPDDEDYRRRSGNTLELNV